MKRKKGVNILTNIDNTEEVSPSDPLTADPFYVQALSYHLYSEGLDQAIECYDKAINYDANHALAYFGRGLAYKQKGEQSQAEVDLEKVVNEFNLSIAEAYCHRAKRYLALSSTVGGDPLFKEAFVTALEKARELGYPCMQQDAASN